MAVITSLIDPQGESARANAAAMRALVAELRTRTAAARATRLQERIDRLIDPDAAFLELSPLVRGLDGAGRSGAGIVTGIGWVGGLACMIVADDASTGSGAPDSMTLRKQRRAQQIAEADRMPCVYLVDGGASAASSSHPGAATGDADELGGLRAAQERMSAAGIPQVVALLGAGHTGSPGRVGRGDETVAVAAARVVHGQPAADYLARDEAHALAICREIVAGLGRRPDRPPWARLPSRPPVIATPDPADPSASQADPTGVYAVAGTAGRPDHDVREVVGRLLDGSEWQELDGPGGTAVTCGFGHLDGVPLGVLATTGPVDELSAGTGVRFVAMAERRDVPILVVVGGAGGAGGVGGDTSGDGRASGELAAALTRTSAPMFVLLLSVPAGSISEADGTLLASLSLGTRGAWRWPSDADPDTADTPGSYWHDGVIDPAQTRDVLALAISAALPAG